MTKAKQISADYFDAIGKQKLVDRFIELKRHQKIIEAELSAITNKVVNKPDSYVEFIVVTGKRSYVPVDVIKEHVGEAWYAANTKVVEKRPYLKIKA